MSSLDITGIPVVILCGGKGMRLQEHTSSVPKALIEVGGRPILWHVMKIYAHHGVTRFILCLGHLGERIKEFFTQQRIRQLGDFAMTLTAKGDEFLALQPNEEWEVIFADTGLETNTGGRIKRVEKYVHSDVFFATYVDGLADIDLKRLLRFHQQHGKLATLTAVNPNSPFGILELTGDGQIKQFREKPKLDMWINGGFFVFDRRVLDRLGNNEDLEGETFVQLAGEGQLMAYRHTGYWACMDTYKDTLLLTSLWESGKASWKVWE